MRAARRLHGPLEDLLAEGESATREPRNGGSVFWFAGPGKSRDGMSSAHCMISFHTIENGTEINVGLSEIQGPNVKFANFG